ncbi:E3 ubiquitin-protein ligase RNF13 isoform X2 [Dendroctonus ponderosae]|uniref:RING-type domain-containing protein n=1 Tax=Dendroctonus ponderosae TaxID=77166 RepID=A0AAR5P8Z7_DENPD|nr:E3 ubiquitin-protein ligase RNF13 isoform X2 [Dendroctonus ponderosae]
MFFLVVALLSIQQIYVSEAEIYAFKNNSEFFYEEFVDAPSSFGADLSDGPVRGAIVNAIPSHACNESLKPAPSGKRSWRADILLVPRYTSEANCTFERKVRMAQLKGYNAIIVYNVGSNELVPMSAKNSTGITIPSVFVSQSSGVMLTGYANWDYIVVITADTPFNIQTHLLIPFAIVVGICMVVMIVFMIVKYIKDRRRQRRYRLPKSQLNKIPTCKFQKGDRYETCAICLEDYIEGEKLRVLPCNHVYHMKCIDPWLTKNKRVCPICKRKVFAHDEPHQESDSDSDSEDTTPLIRSGPRVTQGGTFEIQNENPFSRAARSISQVLEGRSVVTASDHHSINTERHDWQSVASSDSSDCLIHNSDRHDEDNAEHHHGNPFEHDDNETKPEVDVIENQSNCSVEDLPHSNYECDDNIV